MFFCFSGRVFFGLVTCIYGCYNFGFGEDKKMVFCRGEGGEGVEWMWLRRIEFGNDVKGWMDFRGDR